MTLVLCASVSRLMRLSRLVRMLRSFPELMMLINGMIAAVKSVCYVMSLLLIVTYVFAIAFTQLAIPSSDAPTIGAARHIVVRQYSMAVGQWLR